MCAPREPAKAGAKLSSTQKLLAEFTVVQLFEPKVLPVSNPPPPDGLIITGLAEAKRSNGTPEHTPPALAEAVTLGNGLTVTPTVAEAVQP